MDTKQNKIHPLEHKKTFKERLLAFGNMEIRMSNLPGVRSVRRFFSSIFTRLPEVSKESNYTPLRKEDPDLEASHRRHDIRGSVEAFTKRIWNALQESQSMDGPLRKHTIRTGQDEEVQRKQEEINKRSIRLRDLSEDEGWSIDVVKMLQQWENFCYMNLRFPESRKENVSLDSFISYQNGALWIIEGLRKEVYNAVVSLKRQNENKHKSK